MKKQRDFNLDTIDDIICDEKVNNKRSRNEQLKINEMKVNKISRINRVNIYL